MIRKYFSTYALLLASLLVGCDGAIESQYTEQIAVSAFLFAGSPIDSVVLHRTTPFGDFYDDLDYAVDSANIVIMVDGQPHTLLSGTRKGRYYLPASDLVIQGGKTYDLTITAPNHQTGGTHTLRSSTIVPMPISFLPEVDSFRGKTLVLDTNDLINFQYIIGAGPVDDPNRKYMLSVSALDTTMGRIIVGREGPPVDSISTIRYSIVHTGPFIGISPRLFGWYGPNLLTIYALDTNWVDYQRQVQTGATQSYQPSLNHIEGGMGVFGSAARDTMTVYIKPKD